MYKIERICLLLAILCIASIGCGSANPAIEQASAIENTGAPDEAAIDWSEGAVAVAQQINELASPNGNSARNTEQWFVTFPVDIAIDGDAIGQPLSVRELAGAELSDVASQVVFARVSFKIGDDTAAYEFEVGDSPVDLREQMLPYLETMKSRAQEQGRIEPEPSNFRLTAVVVPASAVDASAQASTRFQSEGRLKIGLSPSRQPAGPVGQPSHAGGQVTREDTPTKAAGQQQSGARASEVTSTTSEPQD